ncbi:MAG: hypothetical protein KC416_11240, partial [Myxococcales bacterium]|nr:hypothetical protein [Myxococcales bacterium]
MKRAASLLIVACSALTTAACAGNQDPTMEVFLAGDLPASAGVFCDGIGLDAGPGGPMDGGAGDGGMVPDSGCLWQSSAFSGDPWLPYAGRATLRIHHSLGRLPNGILVYIAFEESGAGAGLAAGDLARIVG